MSADEVDPRRSSTAVRIAGMVVVDLAVTVRLVERWDAVVPRAERAALFER